jgi:hypothetical protein
MSNPACCAACRKHAGKVLGLKAQGLKQKRGVKLDIGLQRPVWLARLQHGQDSGFDGFRKGEASKIC